ncbi:MULTISPECIES: MaoC family dehydratase [unclassified Caballeronia]|uniref:MaoC family dehydratase n=1 Tax=unclassified Caballeronia TaxID=2646786 RepID=UPI0028644CC4|nr:MULTISPECIES: MaoC family dehydratase [unclassified Caballeronia]MDR5741020.1 MaoC family dehydratase [Caballeronia sp. LZ016]MDR5806919.1 MaoC family dehydratase [Caballeronia sp. LZ019]
MSTATSAYSFATIEDFVGQEVGVSEWVSVDQARIDAFAQCTGDTQWIHLNEERAKRESPFGGTIAHGYLTLSLLAALAIEIGVIPPDASAALNYGVDKVRFMTPVKSGARVRSRVVLASVERKGDGRLIMHTDNELQIEGEHKPALVARTLVMIVG